MDSNFGVGNTILIDLSNSKISPNYSILFITIPIQKKLFHPNSQ